MANVEKRLEIIERFASNGNYHNVPSAEMAEFAKALCTYIQQDIPNADGKYTKTTVHVEKYTSTTGDLGIKGMSKHTEVKTRETKTSEVVDDTRVFNRKAFERSVGNVLANYSQFKSALPREQAASFITDLDEAISGLLSERKDLFPGDPVASFFEFLLGLEQKARASAKPATLKLTSEDVLGPQEVFPLSALKSSDFKRIWALLEPLHAAQAEKETKSSEMTHEEKEADLARMKANQEKWKREREEEKERKAKMKEEQKQREEANKAKKAAKKAEEDAERRAQEAAEAEELREWREREAKEEAEKGQKEKEAAEALAQEERKKQEAETQKKEQMIKERAELQKKKQNPFFECPAELRSLESGSVVTRVLSPALRFAADWNALETIYNNTNWTTSQMELGVQSFSIDSVRDGGSLWTSSTPISAEFWMSSNQLATAKKAPFVLEGMKGVERHEFAVPSALTSLTALKNLRVEQVIIKVLAKAIAKRVHGSDTEKDPLVWTFSIQSQATDTTAKKSGEFKAKEKAGRPTVMGTVNLLIKPGTVNVDSIKQALAP